MSQSVEDDIVLQYLYLCANLMKDFEQRRNTWVEPLRERVLDLKQATFLNSSNNFSEITSFIQKIGMNHTVRDKTAHFATASPYDFVATRQATLASSVSRAASPRSLSEDEVLVCALARNVFHYMNGTSFVSYFTSARAIYSRSSTPG